MFFEPPRIVRLFPIEFSLNPSDPSTGAPAKALHDIRSTDGIGNGHVLFHLSCRVCRHRAAFIDRETSVLDLPRQSVVAVRRRLFLVNADEVDHDLVGGDAVQNALVVLILVSDDDAFGAFQHVV